MYKVSYCIGIYNEAEYIKNYVHEYEINLDKILGKKNWELVLVDNGSTDGTDKIVKSLSKPSIHLITLKKKAHGLALKVAVENAKFDYCVITGIGIPFGFDDLEQALDLWKKYDVIFGSKSHPQSVVRRTWQRSITSSMYKWMLKILFHLQINDPQGSILFNKDVVIPILKYCTAENAFFTTQVAIYGQKFHLKMFEIPVTLRKKLGAHSRYNVIKDSWAILSILLREYFISRNITHRL
jgi:dolichyl-phosphate beta-glucosyltransferase